MLDYQEQVDAVIEKLDALEKHMLTRGTMGPTAFAIKTSAMRADIATLVREQLREVARQHEEPLPATGNPAPGKPGRRA